MFIIQEIILEIPAIGQAYKKVLEIQKNNFQTELKRGYERLHHLEV